MSHTHDADARAVRLDLAHRLYQALIAQDPNRAITLCDGEGRVVASNYPTLPGASKVIQIASRRST
jgi:hypothetical protein